ncbi:MAG: hypothetical protein Q4G26_01790 [Paracoccus sp. (in: a-proteobacteria)]|nr:hypothetical protein [Paracoccus sp. (in: a-proteobacteria)]
MAEDRVISDREIAFLDESHARRSADRCFPKGTGFYHGGRYPDDPLHDGRVPFSATTRDEAWTCAKGVNACYPNGIRVLRLKRPVTAICMTIRQAAFTDQLCDGAPEAHADPLRQWAKPRGIAAILQHDADFEHTDVIYKGTS